jgi:hypothetical protein
MHAWVTLLDQLDKLVGLVRMSRKHMASRT